MIKGINNFLSMKNLGKINDLLSRDDMKENQGGYPGCIGYAGTCCASHPTNDYCCSPFTCQPYGGVWKCYP
jgi:hypothetical protein